MPTFSRIHKKSTRSYIISTWIRIIKPIKNACAFSSCTFIYLYDSIIFIRVYNSGQPVIYARKYCTNKYGHKLYHCMPTGSTQHYTLVHNTKLIHIQIFFAPACHPGKKNCLIQTVTFFTDTPIQTSHAIVHFWIWFKNRFHQVGSFFYW